MAFSEKPKKALFPLVLLFVLTAALLFFFRPRTFDLSQAHTLVIQSGTTGEKVEITNPQKIARIADQFVSLRFYRKTAQGLLEEGIETLQKAKAAHDRLEEYYRPCVDFSKVEALGNALP